MRVFSVGPDNGFTEYERVPFEADHVESVLEEWLESNPGGILEDGPLLIIGRQVPTDLGKSIDLLGVDREGNVVVVELKRDRTPRDVVAQALEYAAFAAKLDAAALEGILGEYRPDEPLGLALRLRSGAGAAVCLAGLPVAAAGGSTIANCANTWRPCSGSRRSPGQQDGGDGGGRARRR